MELSTTNFKLLFLIIGTIISPLQGVFLILNYIFLLPLYDNIALWSGLASTQPNFNGSTLDINTNGMPSGHSILAFLLASMNGFPPSLTVLAIMTLFQKNYVGWHTPAQVIVGAVIGCASGYAFNYVKENKEKLNIIF